MTQRQLAFGALFFAFALAPGLSTGRAQAEEKAKTPVVDAKPAETVVLVFDYGNGVEKTISDIPWTRGMTAWDATQSAAARAPASKLSNTGTGSFVFVAEIDGFKNQGGGEGKKNWQYGVNGVCAKVGAVAQPLNKQDRVIWKFSDSCFQEKR